MKKLSFQVVAAITFGVGMLLAATSRAGTTRTGPRGAGPPKCNSGGCSNWAPSSTGEDGHAGGRA